MSSSEMKAELKCLPVQATNNSSILSKASMVKRGYADDPFLRYFIGERVPRRAPLINRGYYIRFKAVDMIVNQFLEYCSSLGTECVPQILSLGCGFDPMYFRLCRQSPSRSLLCVDVDFEPLLIRKRDVIVGNSELNELLRGTVRKQSEKSKVILSSDSYHLVACDLRDTDKLKQILSTEINGFSFDKPTLIISECVLTYIPTKSADHVINWCADTFSDCAMVVYEQILPDDAFGKQMMSHFAKLEVPIYAINEYPTLDKQIDRFTALGFDKVDMVTMNELWSDVLDQAERQRVEQLDTFDEIEEWNVKCSHYFVAVAFRHSAMRLGDSLGFRIKRDFYSRTAEVTDDKLELPIEFTEPCSDYDLHEIMRWGHSFDIVNDSALVFGGYGMIDGAFSRLANTIVVHGLRNFKEINQQNIIRCQYDDNCPLPRIYHSSAVVETGDRGKRVHIFGGRQSPTNPLGDHWTFSMDDMTWTELKSSGAHKPLPRYRHKLCSAGSGRMFLFGGVTFANGQRRVLNDLWLFKQGQWKEIKVDLPQLYSHSMTFMPETNSLVIFGGLDALDRPVEGGYIFRLNGDRVERLPGFQLITHRGRVGELSARYGCQLYSLDSNRLIVYGGIDVQGGSGKPEMILLDLDTRLALPVGLRHSDASRLWPVGSCGCLYKSNDRLYLLQSGGGGVCFSMGSHRNPALSAVDLTEALDGLRHWKHNTRLEWIKQSTLVPSLDYHPDIPLAALVSNRPFIIRNVPVGGCLNKWRDGEYLASAEDTLVSIHSCDSHQLRFQTGSDKNYSFKVLPWKEFISDLYSPSTANNSYLRSIGVNPRKQPSNVSESFPTLSADINLPKEFKSLLANDRLFSSVLRISSPRLHLWTHYDVMDNFLVQVVGRKFITLFPPAQAENLSVPCGLNQSSSPVTDIFRPFDGPFDDKTDSEEGFSKDYPDFPNALREAWTCLLEPGDVLFIPPLWFHNVFSLESESNLPAISLNYFWRSLERGMYDRKDLYGNRDLPVAVEAAALIEKAASLLQTVPGHKEDLNSFRGFYTLRLLDMLKNNIQ